MASRLPDPDHANIAASGGPEAEHASLPRYRSGYSRFVRMMKVGLPLIAGVVVLLVVGWPQLTSKKDRFRVGLSDLNVETAGGQRVVNARFTGVDGNNRPFSVTADAVVQTDSDTGRVELAQPKADVTLQGASWVALTAPRGVFWRKEEILDLSGNVDLFHDQGYEFRTERARIDFGASSAVGDRPVHGQGPFGTVSSEGFYILDSGKRIIFTGRAKLVLFPRGESAAKAKK